MHEIGMSISKIRMYSSRLSNFRLHCSALWQESSLLGGSFTAHISPRRRIHRHTAFHISSWSAASATTAANYSSVSIVDEPKLFYTPTQKKVMDACKDLHGSIMPLNEKVRIMLARYQRATTM
jgi:hypothetical protein